MQQLTQFVSILHLQCGYLNDNTGTKGKKLLEESVLNLTATRQNGYCQVNTFVTHFANPFLAR